MRKITFARFRKPQHLKAGMAIVLFGVLLTSIVMPLLIQADDNPSIIDDPTLSTFGFRGNHEIDHYFDTHGDPADDGLTYETAYRFEDINLSCSLLFISITRYVIIENCTLVGMDISIYQSRNIYVDSCHLVASEIEIRYAVDISIMNNSIEFNSGGSDSGSQAIMIDYSSSIEIIGNTVHGASRGIQISGSESIQVERNNLTCTGLAGIKLHSSEHVSVRNNTIIGNGDADNGIYLYDSDFNNITLNHIDRNLVGININSNSFDNIIAINWLNDNQQQIRCDQVSNSLSLPGKELGNIYSDYMDSHLGASLIRVDGLYPELFPPSEYKDQAIFKGSEPYEIDTGIYDGYPLVRIWNASIGFSVDMLDHNYLWGSEAPTIVITLNIPILILIGAINFTINGSTPVPVDLEGIHSTEILIPINPALWDTFGSGNLTINVTIESIFGAKTYDAITIEKDITNPVISIIDPIANKWYGHTAIAYELDIVEENLNHTWYSVNGEVTKHDLNGTCGFLGQDVWDALPHGQVTIIFGAMDSLGNIATKSITLFKDMRGPDIVIASPQAFRVINATAPAVILVITELSAIATLSYSINGSVFALTPSTTSFNVDQTVWAGLNDGYVTIEIFAVDEWGNTGTETIVIKKDTVKPTIVLTSPANMTYFGGTAPSANVYFTDANFYRCYYSVGSFPYEYEISYLHWIGKLNQTAWAAQPDGLVTVRFRAIDKAGNVAEIELVLGKDTAAPSIEIFLNKIDGLYGKDIPSFRLSVSDPFLVFGSVKYSLDGGSSLFSISNLLNTSVNMYYWGGLPTGAYYLTVFAQDAFGNKANQSVELEKDITAPMMAIDEPLEDSVWGFVAPSYNVTISDPHYSSIAYSLDGGLTRYPTGGLSGSIDANAWFYVPKGENYITFYAVDTLGNVNSSNVRIYRDEAPPLITINGPSSGLQFGNGSVPYNISIIDDFLSQYWFTIGGSSETHLLTETTGIIPLGIWETLPDGPFVLRFYANDTLGNVASNTTLIIKDTSIPVLTFTTARDLFGIAPMAFELDIIEPHLDSFFYQIDNQSNVYNLISGSNEILYSYWQTFASGSHTLRILVNDTLGNTATIHYDFTKDTTLPNVTCLSPTPGEQFAFTVPVIDFEIQDMSDIMATWYSLEEPSEKHFIPLNESFVALDETFWSSLTNGTWEIFIYANDTAGNIGFSSVRINKDILGPIIRFLYPNASFVVARNVPPIIFTVDDANLNHVWYKIVGSNGYEFKCNPGEYNGSIDVSAWTRAFESSGKITLKIYADDAFGSTSQFVITFKCEVERDLRVDLSNFLFRNMESGMLVITLLAIVVCIAMVSKKQRLKRSRDRESDRLNQLKQGNEIPMNVSITKPRTYSLVKFGSCTLIAIAVIILFHQYMIWGKWFELSDFLHFENFAVILVVIAITMLMMALYIGRKHQPKKK